MCPDARLNNSGVDRLGDIVHRPGFETFGFIGNFLHSSYKNDGNFFSGLIRLESPADLITVHHWHGHVKKYQIRAYRFSQLQCIYSVFGAVQGVLVTS